MSEGEIPEPLRGGAAHVVPFPAAPDQVSFSQVSFSQTELRVILDLYSRMVASGEWRDYAMDFTRGRAVFSIFRRSSEVPIYRIEKVPSLARRQGAYSVTAASGIVLKRGHDLARVLRVLDKRLRLVTN
jgi:Protein of unknown function (DUF2794)